MPVILLILSFAYLSISLDISGFFRAAAAAVVGLARGNGHRLLVYIYLLASGLTYFTSNDIVIISMTPIIMHVGDCSNIKNVVPLLVTQFIAANTASMGLLVGSPTNLILGTMLLSFGSHSFELNSRPFHPFHSPLHPFHSPIPPTQPHRKQTNTGDAINLSFSRYWVLMLLPTAVAIAATLGMVMVVFVWCPSRSHAMQRHFTMKDPAGEAALAAAAAGDAAATAVVVDDGGSSGAGVLELTTPPSGRMELLVDGSPPVASSPKASAAAAAGGEDAEEGHTTTATAIVATPSLMTAPQTRHAKVLVFGIVLLLLSIAQYIRAELWTVSFISALVMLGVDLLIVHWDKHSKLSFLARVYGRLPWPIAPFVLSMFLLCVRACGGRGWMIVIWDGD